MRVKKRTTAKTRATAKTRQQSQRPVGHHIESIVATGVQWDARAVEALSTIAQGLVENAKALGALAQVLKASNVHIDAMIRLG